MANFAITFKVKDTTGDYATHSFSSINAAQDWVADQYEKAEAMLESTDKSTKANGKYWLERRYSIVRCYEITEEVKVMRYCTPITDCCF